MVKKGRSAWRHIPTLTACALFVTAGALWSSPGRLAALRASPPAQGNDAPVRTIPAGARVAGDPGKKGDTYYWLESQTTRQTTRYPDATVIAERGASGELRAKIHDRFGNESANFIARTGTVQYLPTGGQPLQAVNDSGERLTLEWTARQAYALSKEGTTNLAWRSGLMRAKGAGARQEVGELETEWANGLSAKVIRKSVTRHEIVKGRFVQGDVLKARLTKDGVEVGMALWFVKDQVFAWNIPGLSKGWLGPEHLKALYGGWPFAPDMHWLNLQLIASHHFQTLIKAKGFVAGNDISPRRSWPDRIVNFFAPTVFADEPGCDGLHWLDGTIYRACCDVHDYCYAKYGCTSKTWWMVWTNWKCDLCNVVVIDCFVDGGGTWNPGDA